MELQEQIHENSQIDLAWLREEKIELIKELTYFEGLLEREAYRPEANREVTKEIINNLKINIKTIQEEYGLRIKNKKP